MTIFCFFLGHDLSVQTEKVSIPMNGAWRTTTGFIEVEKSAVVCKRCGKTIGYLQAWEDR